MKYYVEGLPKKQIKVFKALGPHMAPKGFYLAGGTALAIHYGHQISVVSDWFSAEPFQDGMLLAQTLRNAGLDLEIEPVSPGTLHGSIQDVRVAISSVPVPKDQVCSALEGYGLRSYVS